MHGSLIKFFRKHPTKRYMKGETIVHQGDTPPCLYAIKSGFVKAYDINSEGSEQLVWFGSQPDIFPTVFFNERLLRPATFFYSAFSNVELHCIDAAKLKKYLRENVEGLYDMYQLTAQRYIDLMMRLGAVEKPKAADKIIYTLDFLASRYHGAVKGDDVEVSLPLTHQDIANLVGLTRETTAMELKKLKDKGYIFYDKWHFTVNRQKLEDRL
ncbi:MAG: Crp/Fnr family transcriptional regulator [Candidatus Saccharimonadales bacterium]